MRACVAGLATLGPYAGEDDHDIDNDSNSEYQPFSARSANAPDSASPWLCCFQLCFFFFFISSLFLLSSVRTFVRLFLGLWLFAWFHALAVSPLSLRALSVVVTVALIAVVSSSIAWPVFLHLLTMYVLAYLPVL